MGKSEWVTKLKFVIKIQNNLKKNSWISLTKMSAEVQSGKVINRN